MRTEHKIELNKILENLGQELDITQSEFEAAVKSYQAVGEQLTKENSELIPYNPEVLPQGSFMLGTMIRPINDEDDLDIDLVCQLTGKRADWTQYDLKQKVGNQLKANATYAKMIKKPEGRRCWTLVYAEDSNYHMDILPSIVDSNYKILLEKTFSNVELEDTNELAIRITDKEQAGYKIGTDHHAWLKSNPFGYAKWFFRRAITSSERMFSLNEAIEPIRDFNNKKIPLQRVVQILKRHRDLVFSDESRYNLEHKPISIIITTLSARAYDKEEDILEALINIAGKMRSLIRDRWNEEKSRYEKWVVNPVNEEENFADKWSEVDKKREYFYTWLDKLESDILALINSDGMGLDNVQKLMSNQFGESIMGRAFASYGKQSRVLTESGQRRMAAKTGLLGAVGTHVKNHNFEGTCEKE